MVVVVDIMTEITQQQKHNTASEKDLNSCSVFIYLTVLQGVSLRKQNLRQQRQPDNTMGHISMTQLVTSNVTLANNDKCILGYHQKCPQ